MAAVLCLPLALPAALLRLDMVPSAIVIMFTNVFIPGTIACGMVVLGPYDLLVDKIYQRFI